MARKDEILDALVDIFRQKGVGSDFTISELARKVNIGKSTIYEYFSTKDDILKEAIGRVIGTSIERIFDRNSIEGHTFEEAFKSEMRFLFDLAKSSRFLIGLITPELRRSMPANHQEDFKEQMQNVAKYYEKRFVDIFTKGIEEGIFNQENVAINTMLISSLVTGSIIRYANADSAVTEALNIEEYIDALHQATIKLSN